LERISVRAFEEYRDEITKLVKSQHGVYALYKSDRLYYVGLAGNLRRRVKQHIRDKHAGRWNRFSLYLVRKVDHIKEIEALLLRIADPAGNQQGGRLRGATNLKKSLSRLVAQRQRIEREEIIGRVRAPKRPVAKRPLSRRSGSERRANRPLNGIVSGKHIYATYKSREYKAHVCRNGTVRFRGRCFGTPSAAASVIVGRSVNGWSFWRVRHNGKLVKLMDVRRRQKQG
jgi:hypothetical protein